MNKYGSPRKFEEVSLGQTFIEEIGNHSVILERVMLFTDEFGNPCNARVVLPRGKKTHYLYFRPNESVRVSL